MAFVRFTFVCLLTTHFVFNIESVSDIVKRTCFDLCKGPGGNHSTVADQCPEHMQGRCCINGTAKVTSNTSAALVVGVDLESCGLSNLSDTLLPFHNLQQVILVNNSLKPDDVNQENFYGLPHLQFLTLPPNIPCPGGNNSWLDIDYFTNETRCLVQLDACHVDNFTCPDNSYCVHQGPGLKDCLCQPGYHGYKCLQSGKFETMTFVYGLCGGTVALSAILWFTQRRHAGVKKRK